MRTVSLAALRRIVIGAQGYASRSRTGTRREVEEAIRRLSCVQLDSITAVERSHRIALGSRVGAYPRATVSRLLGEGRIFEYWAHEACLIPVEEWPLFRPRMTRHHPWRGDVVAEHPELAARGARRDRGARPADVPRLRGQGRRAGCGTGSRRRWSSSRSGTPARSSSPAGSAASSAPTTSRSASSRARFSTRPCPTSPHATGSSRCDRFARAAPSPTRASSSTGGCAAAPRGSVPQTDALVADGVLERVRVEDGDADVLVAAGADLDPPRPTAAVLLSPFDNLLWDRPFARRVLGFDHLIEVYKREHERQFGYYVLPFLWRDRIVGRADLKSERSDGDARREGAPPRAGRSPLRRARRRLRARARPSPAHDRARPRASLTSERLQRCTGSSSRSRSSSSGSRRSRAASRERRSPRRWSSRPRVSSWESTRSASSIRTRKGSRSRSSPRRPSRSSSSPTRRASTSRPCDERCTFQRGCSGSGCRSRSSPASPSRSSCSRTWRGPRRSSSPSSSRPPMRLSARSSSRRSGCRCESVRA